jgi:transcriptional regulator with XRE-family HTH domain
MHAVQQSQPARTTIADVPRVRPAFYPELGQFFAKLRTAHGWTMRQAALIAATKGLDVTRQVLLRLEKGQIKNPEPDTLKALAVLYGLTYEELAGRFVRQRYGIDLLRHDVGVRSAAGGILHDPEPAPTAPLPQNSLYEEAIKLLEYGRTVVTAGHGIMALASDIADRQADLHQHETPDVPEDDAPDRRHNDPADRRKRAQ